MRITVEVLIKIMIIMIMPSLVLSDPTTFTNADPNQRVNENPESESQHRLQPMETTETKQFVLFKRNRLNFHAYLFYSVIFPTMTERPSTPNLVTFDLPLPLHRTKLVLV